MQPEPDIISADDPATAELAAAWAATLIPGDDETCILHDLRRSRESHARYRDHLRGLSDRELDVERVFLISYKDMVNHNWSDVWRDYGAFWLDECWYVHLAMHELDMEECRRGFPRGDTSRGITVGGIVALLAYHGKQWPPDHSSTGGGASRDVMLDVREIRCPS